MARNIGAAGSRGPGTRWFAGCWWKRRGTINIVPASGVGLDATTQGPTSRVIAIADKAQQRLCRRFRRLTEQHKPAPKVAVAIARELAGFLWAALQPAPPAPAQLTASVERREQGVNES